LGLMVLFLSVLRSGTWPEDVSRSSQDGSWKDGHARGVEVPSRSPFPRNTFSCVLPVDPFVIRLEHVQASDMHHQLAWCHGAPIAFRSCQTTLIQHPQEESNGQVDVVPEVAVVVAAPDGVGDIELTVPHDEVIAQGAGHPGLLVDNCAEVLREPDRQIGLAREWLIGQHGHQVIEVAVAEPDALVWVPIPCQLAWQSLGQPRQVSTSSPASKLRPVALGITVVELLAIA